nr:PREDICTED: uncharacterized protein LOC105662975 [Megachile rotundata]
MYKTTGISLERKSCSHQGESKRAHCPCTFTPVSNSIGNQEDNCYQSSIRKQTELCDLRKCKYAKSQVEKDICTTQRLLDKIQHLKKSIQDLETAQQYVKSQQKKNVLSQTEDVGITELNNAREIVNNCIKEMTKLKTFLDDENCWWKIFRKREFNCCEQKLPHLHGFLDGTMVTLKMLEETLAPKGFATSTPTKCRSLENLKIKQNVHNKDYTKSPNIFPEDLSRISPRASAEFHQKRVSINSCQKDCPISCRRETQNYSAPGTSEESSRNKRNEQEQEGHRNNPHCKYP